VQLTRLAPIVEHPEMAFVIGHHIDAAKRAHETTGRTEMRLAARVLVRMQRQQPQSLT
jgi:hypothetical protein